MLGPYNQMKRKLIVKQLIWDLVEMDFPFNSGSIGCHKVRPIPIVIEWMGGRSFKTGRFQTD